MTRDQAVLLALCGLALVRVRAAASRLSADVHALREQLEGLERRITDRPGAGQSPAAPVEFVITDLGRPDLSGERTAEPVRLDGPAFADIVLKETVAKAASFAHGVRRGLAPATRNRIRFEMKQEVRRARKQRRADLKAARRDLHARQRASLAVDSGEAS